jgi:hypothetical protein
MNGLDFLNGWKTFALTMVIVVGTWAGIYMNMLPPELWETSILALIGYALKSGAGKFAAGYMNKHNKTDAPVTIEEKRAKSGGQL